MVIGFGSNLEALRHSTFPFLILFFAFRLWLSDGFGRPVSTPSVSRAISVRADRAPNAASLADQGQHHPFSSPVASLEETEEDFSRFAFLPLKRESHRQK